MDRANQTTEACKPRNPLKRGRWAGEKSRVRASIVPPPHMTENLVHPPVLQYRAISRNIRLFWHALGVICAWVPLGLAGGVVRGVNGGRRARSRPNLAKFQNLRTPSGVDEL